MLDSRSVSGFHDGKYLLWNLAGHVILRITNSGAANAVVTGIFFVVQQAEGTFYAPRIVGKSVGLHPMTVIVSIFIWGLLIGGLLGPILAIPLTATVKVLLARYVWGQRLRKKMAESVEEVPVVREAELVAKA